MKLLQLFIVIFFCTSCEFFQAEKVSSEVIYDEEKQAIDWNDVDQFPVFASCATLSEKKEQKKCFENTLNQKLLASLRQDSLYVYAAIVDTLYVNFTIDKKGSISVTPIALDSATIAQYPNFNETVLKTIKTLKVEAPAYKRGIPVTTTYTLPIVLTSH